MAEKLKLFDFSKNGRRIRRDMRSEAVQQNRANGVAGFRSKISEAGAHTETGQLACPKCGGTQFTAKRSMAGKVAVGVFAPKTMVRCVACGMMFKRG